MQSLSASPLQFMLYVRIPGALPSLFDGLKIGATLSVEAEVEAAYLRSWDVYSEAMRTFDTSHLDEVYVDDSWSRVMISEKPLLKEGRKWEILIPSRWSRGEIEVVVNAGVFRPGETAYVYVFDGENQANEIGYPIVISERTRKLAYKGDK